MSPRRSLERLRRRNAERVMDDGQRSMMKRLLDRLLATRARRDREERHSPPWQAADEELHEIEHAIFRVPLDEDAPNSSTRDRLGSTRDRLGQAPTGLRQRLGRAAPVGRSRGIQGQRAL